MLPRRTWAALLLVALPFAAWACSGGGESPSTSSTGAGGQTATGGAGGGGGTPLVVDQETEPNDGAAPTDFDATQIDHAVEGALATPGDLDIFRVPVPAGTVVEAKLVPVAGSTLVPHLTVLDDGRAGKAEGADYVKIVRAGSGEVRLQWLGMGEGGYYVVVRDARNVDGQKVGGEGFGYRLEVTTVPRAAVTRGALPSSGAQTGALGFAGAIDLYTFQAQAYQNALVDMQASGDVDGRLLVFAESTSDWIARNDNRAESDPDPLIDAPLTEGGALVLVVENIAEDAASLGYTLSASLQ